MISLVTQMSRKMERVRTNHYNLAKIDNKRNTK